MDDNQAEKDEGGWAILLSMGNTPLRLAKRLINGHIAKILL